MDDELLNTVNIQVDPVCLPFLGRDVDQFHLEYGN
jgi:hypothetical protein